MSNPLISRRPPPPCPAISTSPYLQIRGPLHRLLLWCIHNYSGLPAPHQHTHLAGGADALQTPGTPDAIVLANAAGTPNRGTGPSYAYEDHDHGDIKRDVRVKKAGADVGTRNAFNIIEGANMTITMADNPGSDQVDITFASSGGGGSSADAELLGWAAIAMARR